MNKDSRLQIIFHISSLHAPHARRCADISDRVSNRLDTCAVRTIDEIAATTRDRDILDRFSHFINCKTYDELLDHHSIAGRAKILFADSAEIAKAAGTRNIPLITFNPNLCGLVNKFHLVTSVDAASTEILRMARAPQLLEDAQMVTIKDDEAPLISWRPQSGQNIIPAII